MNQHRQHAFTIVELLIVIVVVAILATVSVVAYSGIRDNALNIAYKSTASEWVSILAIYKAQTGSYPTSNYEYTCLTRQPLAASGTFSAGRCMQGDGWGVDYDSTFMNDIQTVTGTSGATSVLPQLSYRNLNGSIEQYRSALYLSRNGGHGITYPLKGKGSECAQGETYFSGADGFIACRRVLDGDPYAGL